MHQSTAPLPRPPNGTVRQTNGTTRRQVSTSPMMVVRRQRAVGANRRVPTVVGRSVFAAPPAAALTTAQMAVRDQAALALARSKPVAMAPRARVDASVLTPVPPENRLTSAMIKKRSNASPPALAKRPCTSAASGGDDDDDSTAATSSDEYDPMCNDSDTGSATCIAEAARRATAEAQRLRIEHMRRANMVEGVYDMFEIAELLCCDGKNDPDAPERPVQPYMFEVLPLLLQAWAAGVCVVSPRWILAGANPDEVSKHHFGHLVPQNLPLLNAYRPIGSHTIVIPIHTSMFPAAATSATVALASVRDVWTALVVYCTHGLMGEIHNIVYYDACHLAPVERDLTKLVDEVLGPLLFGRPFTFSYDVISEYKATDVASGDSILALIHKFVESGVTGSTRMERRVLVKEQVDYRCDLLMGMELMEHVERVAAAAMGNHTAAALSDEPSERPVLTRSLGVYESGGVLSDAQRLALAAAVPPGRAICQSTDDLRPSLAGGSPIPITDLERGVALLRTYALNGAMQKHKWTDVMSIPENGQKFAFRCGRVAEAFTTHFRRQMAERMYEYRGMVIDETCIQDIYMRCVDDFVRGNFLVAHVRDNQEVLRVIAAHANASNSFECTLCDLLCNNRVELMSISVRCYDSTHQRIVGSASLSLARMWRALIYARQQQWPASDPVPFELAVGHSQSPHYVASATLSDVERIPDAELPHHLTSACDGTDDTCLWRTTANHLFTIPPDMTLFQLVSYAMRAYYRPATPAGDADDADGALPSAHHC